MSPQLRKSIQKFLVDVDNPTNDLSREAYLYNSLQTALNFLRMAVVEDYKIPEDYSWAGLKNGVIIDLSRDSLSLHHDHIDEIIPIKLDE